MIKPVSVLLNLLFPPKCPLCRTLLEGDDLLCPHCQKTAPWTTPATGKRSGEFFSHCYAPLLYQGNVRAAFHRYKFNGYRHYSKPFGLFMSQCLPADLPAFDLLTWAPLSRRRLRKRGYDQAKLLATALGQQLDLPPVPTLRKVRHIEAQSLLGNDPAKRRANVMGAYGLHPKADVAGKRVLLVDDVITTGSTLAECARVLRTAGACDVVCVTLACVPEHS